MKVKFISTTNQNFKHLEGEIGDLSLYYEASYRFVGDSSDKQVRTSVLDQVNYAYEKNTNNFTMTVKTRNSTYVFERKSEYD